MGCSTSKSSNVTTPSIKTGRHHRSDMDAESAEKRAQRAVERAMKKKYNDANQMYKKASLPILEKRNSQEIIIDNNDNNEQYTAAIRIQNLAKRKAAKEEAVKAQKWMIYSNLDVYDDSDMISLAKFMRTVVHKIPDLAQPILHDKALKELEITVADEERIDVSPDTTTIEGNSGNALVTDDILITLDRENSNVSNISNLPLFESKSNDNDDSVSNPQANIQIDRTLSNASFKSAHSESSNNSTISSVGIAVSRGDSLSSILSNSMFQIENIVANNNLEKEDSDDGDDSAILRAVNRIDSPSKRVTEFTLPSGPITPRVVKKIINVFKGGGRLCTEAVHKILRLSYKSLKEFPNIQEINIGVNDQVTVVGDIHGQLLDLLHILDDSGFPNENRMYIFNGDFVDRGAFGVEVMLILLALHAAMPKRVFLNRGNHEDFIVCSTYGFQTEVFEKYDDTIFGMFVEIFSHLPLFAIINKSVFVVHGGLFRCNDITMGDLARLNRQEYSLANMPESETLDAFPRYRSSDFSNQVVRDALWSDPHESLHGLGANTRGAGVAFGADVTLEFLERNNLKMVIRSHECIRDGYCHPYTGELSHILCTIFSASNYMYNNSGAYMVFRLDTLKSNAFVHKASHVPSDGNLKNYIADSDLYYTVHFFNIDESEARFDDSILYATPSYEDDLGVTLYELVLRQKSVLLEEFIRFDPAGTGIVSKPTWAEVMKCVIKLHIRWLTMVDTMVNPIALEDINGTIMIKYQTFLDTFSATLEPSYHHGVDKNDSNSIFVEAFYSQHKKLEAVFRFFDRDCDGIISSEEFKAGCRIINETLAEHERLTDIDRILSLLDTDQSNCIDVNEFFEMFRLTEGVHILTDMLDTNRARQSSIQNIDQSPLINNNNNNNNNNEADDVTPLRHSSSMDHIASLVSSMTNDDAHIPVIASPLSSPSSTSRRRTTSLSAKAPVPSISRQDSLTRSNSINLAVKGIVINIEGMDTDVVDGLRQLDTTPSYDI